MVQYLKKFGEHFKSILSNSAQKARFIKLFDDMQYHNRHSGNNIDELVHERHNSIPKALELHLSCTNQLILPILVQYKQSFGTLWQMIVL